MGIRRNITDPIVREQFVEACVALDTMMSGITVAQAAQALRDPAPSLRFVGVDQELSYYDLFVLWHVAAMSIPTGGPRQNRAHGGPIFLPWHRHFMILLEQWMQFVLSDSDFGLPYWDWAADGDLPRPMQWRTPLWEDPTGIGPSRGDVTSSGLAQMQVRIWQNPQTQNVQSLATSRPIRRAAGQFNGSWGRGLPTTNAVLIALNKNSYDADTWAFNQDAHRGTLEGWNSTDIDLPVDLHNLVHVWIGGDMGPGTSPNDPAFFLNHCNVDRIWEAWMFQNGRSYSPGVNEGSPAHRIDAAMFTLFTEVRTPADVLDPAAWYTYDSLQVT